MSLAENLLNSLDETAYKNSRIAGIEPEEAHIVVGQDRVIIVPNNLKTIAVKGDKDIETVTFDCVRFWDENDLSTFAIYINYILPNGDEGTYIPQISTKAEDIFTFDWQIGSEITYAQGKLTFWIVAKLTDDNANLVKQWSSFQNSECSIAQGGDKIYVPEKQEDKDVISQAISVSTNAANEAKKYAEKAQEVAQGVVSIKNVYQNSNGYLVIELTNGETKVFPLPSSGGGGTGEDGKDGVGIQNVEIIGGNLLVTLTDGTSTNVGKVVGENGKDGVSVTHYWDGTVLTITSASGTSFADLKGDKGDKGDPYTLTDTDKADIVSDVIAALPNANGVSF
jgi:hypothetical protein